MPVARFASDRLQLWAEPTTARASEVQKGIKEGAENATGINSCRPASVVLSCGAGRGAEAVSKAVAHIPLGHPKGRKSSLRGKVL
jgi:hypothetical protein